MSEHGQIFDNSNQLVHSIVERHISEEDLLTRAESRTETVEDDFHVFKLARVLEIDLTV